MASNTLSALFSGIADAIRAKTGSANKIVADEFPNAINSINIGTDTSDATATAETILAGKTAYVGGNKVTGTASAAYVGAYVKQLSGNDTMYGFSVKSFDGETLILTSSDISHGGNITIKLS
ncbi:MAG: hypothetical protein IJN09_03660 [Oscillospiraceae bacterium]|nr:hypothetical protein [Oscillospiraceae bacterium]